MTSASATRRPAPVPTGAGRRAPLRDLARSVPLLPAVVLLVVFLLGPIIYAIWGSLTNRALTGYRAAQPEYVGLDNYISLFTDPNFWTALVLTVVFVLFSAIIGQNVLGLGVAALMRIGSQSVNSMVGALIVVAWVMPEIVAAFALYAYFSKDGTLNALLETVGIPAVSWLIEYPMFAVILANVWRGTAFSMLVYGAALNEVPPEVMEAAQLDGANAAQRFFLVTIPMIRRSISTNLMLTTLQTLGTFGLIWVMTKGGPGVSSSTLPVLAYQEAFQYSQIGYGTAIAAVTLVLGAIFAIFYIRILKPEVD